MKISNDFKKFEKNVSFWNLATFLVDMLQLEYEQADYSDDNDEDVNYSSIMEYIVDNFEEKDILTLLKGWQWNKEGLTYIKKVYKEISNN